jgi:hypothetical protein
VGKYDPLCPVSSTVYAHEARRVIKDVLRRNKTPILEGGSPFYIKQVFNPSLTNISDEGFTVSFKHIALIADAMTYSGKIRSAGRHGITGDKTSIFARAAYEETVKHFVNASVFGERALLLPVLRAGAAVIIWGGRLVPCRRPFSLGTAYGITEPRRSNYRQLQSANGEAQSCLSQAG